MNRKPNQPFAVIDFERTPDTCMDVTCPCGSDFHVHGRKNGPSTQHIRCPFCKDVLSIGADVNLLSERENFDDEVGLHAFIQWKGSDVVMTAHCACSKTFEIARDFAYECDCPHCGTHYHCESRLTVTKLSAEQAAAIPNVNEPEKDYEDMDEGERAAYDAKMAALAAERKKNRADFASGLSAVELGHLVDPERSLLGYGVGNFPGKPLPWPAPGVAVVVLGDAVDLFAVSRWRGKDAGIDDELSNPVGARFFHGHSHRRTEAVKD
jgi:hypothetical protein